MTRPVGISMLLTGVLALSLNAQMTFGSANLVLGTPKAKAIRMLRERAYRVDSTGNGDQWVVMTEHKMAGMLYFSADHLASVSREWYPDTTTDVGAGRAVIEGLLTLAPRNQCKVADWSASNPDAKMRVVAVVCGSHGITIGLVRSQGTEGLVISELLGIARAER
jgi:hypothetical protein